jgi:outer membrane immunogenic protein
MKSIRLFWISTLVVAIATLGAEQSKAQSLKDVLPSNPTPIWTGIYIGAGGGVNSLVSKFTGKPGPDAGSGSAGASASFDGLGSTGGFGTISIGADYQFTSRWVAGAFGEYDFESLGSDASINIPDQPLSAHGGIDVNGKASVGVRLGYLFSPDTLWYVSGGYSNLSLSDFHLNVVGSDPDISATAKTPNLSGGFIGVGAETLITEHISLRVEYRYTDFGSGAVTLPTIDGTNLNDFVSVHVAPTMQEGRASVNYRF